jgi:hypothetical protein
MPAALPSIPNFRSADDTPGTGFLNAGQLPLSVPPSNSAPKRDTSGVLWMDLERMGELAPAGRVAFLPLAHSLPALPAGV